MSKRQLRLYLTDMLQAIGRIERYLSGLDRDAFLESDLHLDAVTRNLEILGEAARHLPEEIKSRYPEIPWRPGGGFAQRGGPPVLRRGSRGGLDHRQGTSTHAEGNPSAYAAGGGRA